MELREKIAFEMWNSSNPPHIASEITPVSFAEVVTPVVGGGTIHCDLQLDWNLNKDSYLRLTDVALEFMEKQ